MNDETAARLIDLNRKFYQTFAPAFSATRGRPQPGVQKIIEGISPEARILELGCGNGNLAKGLAEKGHQGQYIGLDFSEGFIAEILASPEAYAGLSAQFRPADLSLPNWDNGLPAAEYDLILAFAVLHHIPGGPNRRRLIEQIADLLSPGGHFIHSSWQFLNSPRLRARIQPWEAVDLTPEEVDPGDYLMDWRRGGYGLRYVHHFSEGELQSLAQDTEFQVVDSFHSDGENGRLGLYQTWARAG